MNYDHNNENDNDGEIISAISKQVQAFGKTRMEPIVVVNVLHLHYSYYYAFYPHTYLKHLDISGTLEVRNGVSSRNMYNYHYLFSPYPF